MYVSTVCKWGMEWNKRRVQGFMGMICKSKLLMNCIRIVYVVTECSVNCSVNMLKYSVMLYMEWNKRRVRELKWRFLGKIQLKV